MPALRAYTFATAASSSLPKPEPAAATNCCSAAAVNGAEKLEFLAISRTIPKSLGHILTDDLGV